MPVGPVLGHEEAAAAGHALDDAEEAAAAAHLRVGGHLDRGGHPGELAALGEDALVGVEFTSRTGMVVPRILVCMVGSPLREQCTRQRRGWAQFNGILDEEDAN